MRSKWEEVPNSCPYPTRQAHQGSPCERCGAVRMATEDWAIWLVKVEDE